MRVNLTKKDIINSVYMQIGFSKKIPFIPEFAASSTIFRCVETNVHIDTQSNFSFLNNSFVLVGSHCSIYSNSTIDEKSGPVKLGNNCKIGSHSTIML